MLFEERFLDGTSSCEIKVQKRNVGNKNGNIFDFDFRSEKCSVIHTGSSLNFLGIFLIITYHAVLQHGNNFRSRD